MTIAHIGAILFQKPGGFSKYKSFLDLGLSIDVSYFDIKYHDTLEGWKGAGAWKTYNFPGEVKSRGLELISKWKKNDLLNFGFNYTYTSTYDGAEQDDPDKSNSYYNSQMVRVPRHLINVNTVFKFPNYKFFFVNISKAVVKNIINSVFF